MPQQMPPPPNQNYSPMHQQPPPNFNSSPMTPQNAQPPFPQRLPHPPPPQIGNNQSQMGGNPPMNQPPNVRPMFSPRQDQPSPQQGPLNQQHQPQQPPFNANQPPFHQSFQHQNQQPQQSIQNRPNQQQQQQQQNQQQSQNNPHRIPGPPPPHNPHMGPPGPPNQMSNVNNQRLSNNMNHPQTVGSANNNNNPGMMPPGPPIRSQWCNITHRHHHTTNNNSHITISATNNITATVHLHHLSSNRATWCSTTINNMSIHQYLASRNINNIHMHQTNQCNSRIINFHRISDRYFFDVCVCTSLLILKSFTITKKNSFFYPYSENMHFFLIITKLSILFQRIFNKKMRSSDHSQNK